MGDRRARSASFRHQGFTMINPYRPGGGSSAGLSCRALSLSSTPRSYVALEAGPPAFQTRRDALKSLAINSLRAVFIVSRGKPARRGADSRLCAPRSGI